MSQWPNDKRSHSQIFLDSTTQDIKIAMPALSGLNAGIAIYKRSDFHWFIWDRVVVNFQAVG
jgi:hypothetical protein